MGKSIVSKETISLQKKCAESLQKDMKALVGKTFILSVCVGPDGDAEEAELDGETQQEFVYVEKFDPEDGLIGTTVYMDDDTVDVSIGTVIEFDGEATPCSKNEFAEALIRAQNRVARKLAALKEDRANGKAAN